MSILIQQKSSHNVAEQWASLSSSSSSQVERI